MKKRLIALLLCFAGLSASAQVFVVGTKVLDQTGSLLSSGSYCVGSTCFTVTSGRIATGSSISSATTATITVSNGIATILTVPGVTVSGALFNWDTFQLSTTSSGVGVPHISCIPGAGYNQTDSGYSWACQNQAGVAVWVQGVPTGNLNIGGPCVISGCTMTGSLLLAHDPSQSNEAVTLHYLQVQLAGISGGGGGSVTFSGNTAIATSLNGTLTNNDAACGDAHNNLIDCGAPPILTTGGTFTAFPTLPAGTPMGLQPVSNTYLHTFLAGYIPTTGGTMTGEIVSDDGSNMASLNEVTAAIAAAGGGGGIFTGGQLTQPIFGSENAVAATELTTLQQMNTAITSAISAVSSTTLPLTGGVITGSVISPDGSALASVNQVNAAVAGAGGGGPSLTPQFPLQQSGGNLSLINTALACADNSVCSGSIDSNGMPNFVTFSGSTITISGATTPLVINDANGICRFTGTQTLTASTNGPHFVYASYTVDPASAICILTLIDTPTAGWAWHESQTPTPTGTVGNIQFGFDEDLYGARSNTGGAWSGLINPQVVPLFDYDYGSAAVQLLAPMPYGLSQGSIEGLFGNGKLGALYSSSGTTTVNGCLDYAAIILDGTAVLSPNRASSSIASTGLCVRSQWPILLAGTAQLSTAGLGFPGTTASNTALFGGTQGGYGGAGGCGGSSGTGTLQQAHAGGGRLNWTAPDTFTGSCPAGGTVAGESATAAWTTGGAAPPGQIFGGSGATGSTGCTDGTNPGGSGGSSGGPLFAATPFLALGTTSAIHSDGLQPATPTAGIVCGGGGGGAGNSEVRALGWRFGTSQATQYTAAGGLGGIHFGAGGVDGTAGGAGIAALKRAF